MGKKTTLVGLGLDIGDSRFPDYKGPEQDTPVPKISEAAPKTAEDSPDEEGVKEGLDLSEIHRAQKAIHEVREEEAFDQLAFQDEVGATIDRITLDELNPDPKPESIEATLTKTWDLARGEVEGYVQSGNFRDALMYMDKFLELAYEAGEKLPQNFYSNFKRALNQACAETWSLIDEGDLEYASRMLDGIEQYSKISGVPSLWLVMNLQDHYQREWKKANPERNPFQLRFYFYE